MRDGEFIFDYPRTEENHTQLGFVVWLNVARISMHIICSLENSCGLEVWQTDGAF